MEGLNAWSTQQLANYCKDQIINHFGFLFSGGPFSSSGVVTQKQPHIVGRWVGVANKTLITNTGSQQIWLVGHSLPTPGFRVWSSFCWTPENVASVNFRSRSRYLREDGNLFFCNNFIAGSNPHSVGWWKLHLIWVHLIKDPGGSSRENRGKATLRVHCKFFENLGKMWHPLVQEA